MEYPLAPQGVFHTIQGEGDLLGTPMVFVRLAGCPVGCLGCDTDYSVAERVTDHEIAARVLEAATPGTKWVWITGGEPTIYDLNSLIAAIRGYAYPTEPRFKVAVATAGIRDCSRLDLDFLSVSPHSLNHKWVQRAGQQVNIVPGLDGLSLLDVALADDRGDFSNFESKWITPYWTVRDGPSNFGEVLAFVKRRPGFKAGIQAHHYWGIS